MESRRSFIKKSAFFVAGAAAGKFGFAAVERLVDGPRPAREITEVDDQDPSQYLKGTVAIDPLGVYQGSYKSVGASIPVIAWKHLVEIYGQPVDVSKSIQIENPLIIVREDKDGNTAHLLHFYTAYDSGGGSILYGKMNINLNPSQEGFEVPVYNGEFKDLVGVDPSNGSAGTNSYGYYFEGSSLETSGGEPLNIGIVRQG